MANRVELQGYTWVDARVDGQFAALFPFEKGGIPPHVQLAHRRIMVPEQRMLGDLGRMIPYLRVSDDGFPFRIGAIDAPRDPNGEHKGYWEWSEEQGWQLVTPLVMDCPNAVIYRGDAFLVATPTFGAMGFRYIDGPSKNPVSADATANAGTPWAVVCGVKDLWEWTQHGNLTVGKNSRDELVVVLGKDRFVIEPGKWWFPHFSRVGDQCVVTATSMNMDRCVMHWFSVDEIRTQFNPEASVPVPEPPKPEPKPLDPHPESDPILHDDTEYDLKSYLIGSPATWPRGGPTHAMHQHLGPGELFHFVKFDNPEAYETWAYDDNWIYHLEDASSHPYSFDDPRWFPRRMKVGQEFAFDTGEHQTTFRERTTCQQLRKEPFRRKMWVQAIYPAFDWGPDLGIRETMVIAYDPTAGIHIPQRGVELGYYARGAGSVRWEWYRSDMVYKNGRAEFTDAARGARSDFYLRGGKALAPKRTGCVGDTVPHLPPLSKPEPKPEPKPAPQPEKRIMIYIDNGDGKMTATAGTLVNNNNGTFSLRKTNGKIFCLTPHGIVEERDSPGGPWESFKKAPNALVFERELPDGSPVFYLRCYAEVE